MSRDLLILRHAEAGWSDARPTDFDRPLTAKGRAAAARVGQWLHDQALLPELVISSPATRTRQTLDTVVARWSVAPEIVWDDRMYSADSGELVQILGALPREALRVLVIGHNPGLSVLLRRLAGAEGHLAPASLAHIAMPADWSDLPPGCATLESITRSDR